MRALNSDLLSTTMDADQGGSDFIGSLPTPEIKTTEDLIAAATPAAPANAPKPTDAMLRGKEMSQTQFPGMEPVYDSSPQLQRSGQQGALLGYKFPYSQVQDPGMVASYSAPVYDPHNNLVDPGGKFLGYQVDTSKTYDAPKSAEILALEKKLGTTMDPIYATYKRDTRGGQADVEYGLPIGYRFDNGNSQYVNFDVSGQHTGTQNREKPGAFGNVLMSVLAIAYPPLAPFIQAYNAVQALDQGDPLRALVAATGAGKFIPGLSPDTVKLLSQVSTGAKIINAVKTGDPLAIASSMVNLPGVPVDVKNTLDIVNTAKAVSRGDINALIGVAQKYGGNVSRTADTATVDGTTYDINNTPAGNLFDKDGRPLTPEASMGATFDDQMFNDLLKIRNATPQEQPELSGALPSTTATATDSGLTLPPVTVTTPAPPQEEIPITGPTGNNTITDSPLPVSPNVGGLTLPPVTVTTPAPPQEELPITGPTGNNTITDSPLPVSPNVGTTDPALDRVEIRAPALLPEPTDTTELTFPPVEIRTPALPTTVAPKVPAVPKIPTLPKIPTIPKTPATPATPAVAAPTGALPTVAELSAPAGNVFKLGKLGSSEMGYNQNLKQLTLPERKELAMQADDSPSNVDLNKALAALAAYAPDAEQDTTPQIYAHGGTVQHFAEGSQPDVQNMIDAYAKGDMQAALKNLGNLDTGLAQPKGQVFSLKQVGTPSQQRSLQQMSVIPQLAALLQSRGMRLAAGGQPDHEHPHYDGTPVFRTGGLDGFGGKYVEGKGDGTSDDITAMLANGEYVFSADVVSALGNGSNKAGAKELDQMVQAIRARARSAPPDKLPPDAKSPLEYLKSSKGKKHG